MPKIHWEEEWLSIKQTLAQDKGIYLYTLLVLLSVYCVTWLKQGQLTIHFELTTYISTIINTSYMTFVFWSAYYYGYMLRHKVPHPFKQWFMTLLSFFTPLSKPLTFLCTLIAISLVLSSYTYVKSIIPDLHPFAYDLLFYRIDKWIHFGISPWRLTHWIFSSPLATLVLNFLYHIWVLCIWAMLACFLFYRKNPILRLQFFLSFISCWMLLGGVMGTLLSSAGPCYTRLLDPQHQYYEPLMTLLNQQSDWLHRVHLPTLWALNIQDMLWHWHIHRSQSMGSGISAMPSMHVSMAVLLALSISKLNQHWGYLAWGYAIGIEVGSVHLAWHYAIDGYVSLILTILIWWSTGKISRLLNPRHLNTLHSPQPS